MSPAARPAARAVSSEGRGVTLVGRLGLCAAIRSHSQLTLAASAKFCHPQRMRGNRRKSLPCPRSLAPALSGAICLMLNTQCCQWRKAIGVFGAVLHMQISSVKGSSVSLNTACNPDVILFTHTVFILSLCISAQD